MSEYKCVVTFDMIDEYGEKVTCNMIEPSDLPVGRIHDRIADLMQRGHKISGNIKIQFVLEDD